MKNKKRNTLIKLRNLCIAMSIGIIILSVESVFTEQDVFTNYAGALAVAALVFISLAVALIVKRR